ncbi:MAG: flagellar basal body-associated FliL family protein [Paracoccaceae bacterium]
MAEAENAQTAQDEPQKRSKALLFGLVGAVLLGAGGFYATFSGLLALPKSGMTDSAQNTNALAEAVSFVPLDPMIISLGAGANASHLRFTAQLEVAPGAASAVTALKPRILDVLNTYLHAVTEEEMSAPAALTRLRAQILRRVQVVAGPENIRDVLITEFVLG